MKNITIITLIALVVTVSFFIGNDISNSVMDDSFSLENLHALQSSAGEIWCDQSNQSTCTIMLDDITGLSKGVSRGYGMP